MWGSSSENERIPNSLARSPLGGGGGGGYVCRIEALLPVVLNTCKSELVRPEIVCASRWIFGDSLRGGVGMRENTSYQVRDKILIPWYTGEREINLMKYFVEWNTNIRRKI